MSSSPSLDDNDAASVEDLYAWLKTVPLSRPIKCIARDLSDGVLVAELVAHFLPRYVALGNYTPVHSAALKRYNWETLNKMVFSCLDFHVSSDVVQKVTTGQPGAIEFVLLGLRRKIEQAIADARFRPRRYRSRSASRAGSLLSLNGDGSDVEASMSGSVHVDNDGLPLPPPPPPITSVTAATTAAAAILCANHLPRSPVKQKAIGEDLVPARLYHQARQEVLAREEQIQTLNARVRHMERLVQLKEERIEQLTKRLDRFAQFVCQTQATAAASSTCSSSTASPRHGARPIGGIVHLQHQQPPPSATSDSASSGAASPVIGDFPSPSPLVDFSTAIDLK